MGNAKSFNALEEDNEEIVVEAQQQLLLAPIIKAGRTSANSDRSIQHRNLFS